MPGGGIHGAEGGLALGHAFNCDTLFVEGLVEATMDARLMEIAEPGAFKGSAEIDLAEIRDQFIVRLLTDTGEADQKMKLRLGASGRRTKFFRANGYGPMKLKHP